jgi:hypothetical protein
LLSTDTVAFGGSLAKLPVAPLLEQVLGQQVTRRENRPISEDDRVVELLPAAIELEGTGGAILPLALVIAKTANFGRFREERPTLGGHPGSGGWRRIGPP